MYGCSGCVAPDLGQMPPVWARGTAAGAPPSLGLPMTGAFASLYGAVAPVLRGIGGGLAGGFFGSIGGVLGGLPEIVSTRPRRERMAPPASYLVPLPGLPAAPAASGLPPWALPVGAVALVFLLSGRGRR